MRSIFVLILYTAVICCCCAQEFCAPTRNNRTQFTDTTTTYTYKCPDKTYKVYVSRTGSYYIWKVSKRTNKVYKMYLPKDIQIAMGRQYTN